MMEHWKFSTRPDQEHASWARDGGYLLSSPEWMEVVAELGAEPVFAWCKTLRAGLAIPVFKRLGLRVGFLGFPVVSAPLEAIGYDALIDACCSAVRACDIDLIRMSHSMRLSLDMSASAARPEVWIDDLQTWSVGEDKRRRRDLAYARRAAKGAIVIEAPDPVVCHAMYAATVRAHSGSLRYSREYFSRLVALSRSCDRVCVFGALDDTGSTRAFSVLLVDGEVGYYLHGAADPVGKKLGLSDLLLAELMPRARALGARRLSLMSSPWAQPGLLSFKRKWSDANGLTVTTDVAGSVKGRAARLGLHWLHRSDRERATEFLRGGVC